MFACVRLGAVYNATGSYNYSFWLGGLMFALGAACHLVLLLPCVKKKGQEIASNEIVLVEEEDKTMLPSSNDEEV